MVLDGPGLRVMRHAVKRRTATDTVIVAGAAIVKRSPHVHMETHGVIQGIGEGFSDLGEVVVNETVHDEPSNQLN